MSHPLRNTIVVGTALLAALVAIPVCQVESEEPPMKTNHRIALEWEEIEGKITWRKIQPLTVRSGDTIRIDAGEHTAWILIPDDRFKLLEGGSDWVISRSFTAFKVAEGSTVIMLDECESGAEPKEEMHYSVLVRHVKGHWEYVHGDNPPPKMIIPPKTQG
jgi:hypothetical protein